MAIELVDGATMAMLDRSTVEQVGVPGVVLMETAGRAVARAMVERYGAGRRPVRIVCGHGQNGGDGYVVGRDLAARGWDVELALLASRAQVRGDAATHLAAYERSGGRLTETDGEDAFLAWAGRLGRPAVVVDALFGTGLNAPVQGLAAQAIRWMNGLAAIPIVSVDVPSGVHASSGRILGAAVAADLTVTFGAAKLGHVLPPGCARCGDVRVADIGVPVERLRAGARGRCWFPEIPDVQRGPWREDPQAHKGRYGHVLVVAGSSGRTGAAALAARGALRAGAGLVTVAVPERSLGVLVSQLPAEVMTVPVPDAETGSLGERAGHVLEGLIAERDSVVLGPGLGTDSTTSRVVRRLVAGTPIPMVVDADAINALVGRDVPWPAGTAPRVATPHPGEMARLLATTVAEVQADRVGVARRYAEAHGVQVVLKGAGTVIALPDGSAYVVGTGNPGLAAPGMGDVLAGVLAAYLVAGVEREPDDRVALVRGVYLHGAAGDRVVGRPWTGGRTASEVADALPDVVRDLLAGRLAEPIGMRRL